MDPNAPGQVAAAVTQPPALPVVSLEDLRSAMQQFVAERDWDKFHAPRNLLLAMVGEVGELSELFQWRGEVDKGLPGFTPEEKEHVAQELADILLYIIRLADVCGIDLGQAAYQKLQINAQKYPADIVRGSAAKYTAYQQHTPRTFDAQRHKADDETGSRKRQRERFTEDQVAAMTQLAERAGWSITAISWEERVKFCEEYGVTKERLSNFFNNRKPKDLKKGRTRTPSQSQHVQDQVLTQEPQPMHDMSGQVAMSVEPIKMETAADDIAGPPNGGPSNDTQQPQVPQAMTPPATA